MVSVTNHSGGTILFQTGALSATTASAGNGIQFDNADGVYNFNGSTLLNGGDAGIDILNGSSGTFTFGTGISIIRGNSVSGYAFNLTSSNAVVTYSGSIMLGTNTGSIVNIATHSAGNITFNTGDLTQASSAVSGAGISISGVTGGTVTFNNPTISIIKVNSADAISLANNTNGTINFTLAGGGSGMNLSTLISGTGFNATGGGTISVTGTGNTIVSSGGTALNVANTTIGTSGITFQSITTNGAASGIILNTTGSIGGLKVTGNGSLSRDGSGGTIQNATGNGISLTNTQAVQLTHMNINTAGTNGIFGSLVTGFVSDWNSFTGNGNAVNEGAIRFGSGLDGDPTGLIGGATGSATETRIDHTLINTSFEHGLVIENTSGTLTQLNLTSTTIQNDVSGSGFLIETRGATGSTAVAAVQIEGSGFLANPGSGVNANALRNTTLTMNILGNAAPGTNTLTGHDLILLGNGDGGHLICDIENNTISGNGNGIFVGNAVSANSSATLSAKIIGNSVTTNVGGANHSISSFMSGGTSHLKITNNTVVNNGQANGINIGTPDDPSGPNFTAIVSNNIVTGGSTAANGISLLADVSGPGATSQFKVENNTVNWSASNINNLDGIFMNQFGTSTMSLERGSSASNSAPTVLAANNPSAHASAGGPAIEAGGTITVIANGTITLP